MTNTFNLSSTAKEGKSDTLNLTGSPVLIQFDGYWSGIHVRGSKEAGSFAFSQKTEPLHSCWTPSLLSERWYSGLRPKCADLASDCLLKAIALTDWSALGEKDAQNKILNRITAAVATEITTFAAPDKHYLIIQQASSAGGRGCCF